MIDQRHDEPPDRTLAGPQTWAVIRESFLGGVSARVLERRYGVKAGTITKRAQRQGWRMSDRPETPQPALPPLFPPAPWRGPAKPEDTARDAAAAADRAMREGRLDEAAKLARIAETMQRVARGAR